MVSTHKHREHPGQPVRKSFQNKRLFWKAYIKIEFLIHRVLHFKKLDNLITSYPALKKTKG